MHESVGDGAGGSGVVAKLAPVLEWQVGGVVTMVETRSSSYERCSRTPAHRWWGPRQVASRWSCRDRST
jgi:hypothetical protein